MRPLAGPERRKRTMTDTTKVLVVEDDEAVRRMLRLVLRSAGFDVAEVSCGGDALEELARSPYDAIVLDLGLPDQLGATVLKRLRGMSSTRHERPAWLVVSAQDIGEVAEKYGPLGERFVPKPFDPWDLVQKLGELLNG